MFSASQRRARLGADGAALLPALGGRLGWGRGGRAGCGVRRVGAARGLTLAPIWLPHWPAWMCTISLMLGAGGGRLRSARGLPGWLRRVRRPRYPLL